METTTQPQFEDAAPSSLYGQGGAFVAMMACNLVMLLMLTACSPGASPEDRPVPQWEGRLSLDDGR